MVWPALQYDQPSFAPCQTDTRCGHIGGTVLERFRQSVDESLFRTQGLAQQRCLVQGFLAVRMILGELQQHRFTALLLILVASKQCASDRQRL